MADFVIPKGEEFTFTVKVLARDSFLPQDLTNINNSGYFKIVDKDTKAQVGNSITISTSNVYGNATDGVLKITASSTLTSLLQLDEGSKEDGYYMRPKYRGVLKVTFTDGTPAIFSVIEDVYVKSIGL